MQNLESFLESGECVSLFTDFYGSERIDTAKTRYTALAEEYGNRFGRDAFYIFSTPESTKGVFY